MKRILYSFLFLFMASSVIYGQTASGIVYDEDGSPMIGVNVVEKGTTSGTATDFNGEFSLKVSAENVVLQFSYLGYQINEVTYTGQRNFSVRMQPDAIGLDQVIVSASKRKERLLDAPASVSVLKAEKIEKTVSLTPIDNLKTVPGVDIMSTGIISQNVKIRGFNNIFSGSMLTMVDNRIARVPSLRVNAFQLIPTSNQDIERIEIVRGPGSALYGPNASDGVLHVITKSPLAIGPDHNTETTVSISGGSRSIWNPQFSHSQKVSEKFGFRLSGGYTQGHDWIYFDDREPNHGDEIFFGNVQAGQQLSVDSATRTTFERDFFVQKYNVDARFDFALSDDIDLTLNTGMAQTSNIELTGLGAAQGVNWIYPYAQARFRWKELFVNYFMNASNAGDTYLIKQLSPGDAPPYDFQYLVDKSKFHGLQLQHSSYIEDRWVFTYGFDGFFTRPQTEGTIHGRFDDDDDINQLGLYGQAEWDATDKLSLTAALRGDFQQPTNEFQLSPRGAIVYKPTPRHTTRLTYNRAFTSPSALNYFLDLSNLDIDNGVSFRGIGNSTGYAYMRNDNGLPMFRSPDLASTGGEWYDFNDLSKNVLHFNGLVEIVAAGLAEEAPPDLAPFVGLLADLLFADINTGQQTIRDVSHDAIDVQTLLDTRDPGLSVFNNNDLNVIQDLEEVKSTITQTVEIGYKGVIKDKFFLQTDLYYTQIDNFVSPLTWASYRVIFDPDELTAALTPIAANLQEASPTGTGTIDELITPILEGSDQYRVEVNGTALDELLAIMHSANAGLSIGTITPDDENVNADAILTYVNLGKVDVMGGDLGFTYQATDDFSITGAFSFVNKNKIPLAGATGGFVGLNAPKFKTALGLDYGNIANTGLGFGATWRWQDAFPANSSIYVGTVAAANLLDLRVSYRPNFSKNTLLSVDLQNVLNYEWQSFPGTPITSFFALAKLQHTFKYNVGKN